MNDPLANSSSRLDALEMRIAHQDKTIADLNDAVTEQWRMIDEMRRLLKDLREEFRNIVPLRTAPEPAPPHY